jgi:hypothetical protein
MIYLVFQLSVSSVLSWGCTRTWPLYFWLFLPVIFHLLASAGYSLTLKKSSGRNAGQNDTNDTSEHQITLLASASRQTSDGAEKSRPQIAEQQDSNAPRPGKTSLRHKLSRTFEAWKTSIRREFTSCVGQLKTHLPSRTWKSDPREVKFGVGLSDLATFFAFFHMIFAIVTFSGLLFVTAIDAIGSIGMRLVVSSLVCRVIVMVEIAGLRGGHMAAQLPKT